MALGCPEVCGRSILNEKVLLLLSPWTELSVQFFDACRLFRVNLSSLKSGRKTLSRKRRCACTCCPHPEDELQLKTQTFSH